MSAEGQTIRERVSHIARGCRAESSHNPTVYEVAIEDNLRALETRLAANEKILLRHQLCEGKILRAEARLAEADLLRADAETRHTQASSERDRAEAHLAEAERLQTMEAVATGEVRERLIGAERLLRAGQNIFDNRSHKAWAEEVEAALPSESETLTTKGTQ